MTISHFVRVSLYGMAAAAVVVGALVGLTPWRIGIVTSASMTPTLLPGDVILIHRDSIVVMGSATTFRSQSHGLVVKRAIASGGDTVEFRAGRPFVNGVLRPLSWDSATANRIRLLAMPHQIWDFEAVGHIRPVDLAVVQASLRMLGDSATTVSKDLLTIGPLRVPPGTIWMASDNPGATLDSRRLGPIPAANVHGHVTRVVMNIPLWAFRWRRETLALSWSRIGRRVE